MESHTFVKGMLLSVCVFHLLVAHRILIATINVHSHLMSAVQLAKELQANSNEVTIFTGSNLQIPHSYRSLGIHFEQYSSTNPSQNVDINKDLISSCVLQGPYSIAAIRSLIEYKKHFKDDQEAMFYDDAAINRLNQSRFDFIIIDYISAPQYALPYLLDRPFAVFGIECPIGAFRMPYAPSFVPNIVTLFSDNMSLWQRMVNTILHALATAGAGWWQMETTKALVPHKPAIAINDLSSEAQLCLRTKAPLIETVRPTQPNVISVPIIGRPAKPLSSELESFLRNAQYSSVVLVSFGSWLDQLPESVIVRFLAAFAQFKMTVLWKYTGRLDVDVPSNVFLMTWIPQNDLLAHNQTKLLITHGGQYSITEAMYHGVPMITFPIMVDQFQNSIAAESKGIALHLPREFAPADLIRMINATQQDDMQKTTRRTSEIFRSLSEAGSSSVAFWIDHVIRFGGRELRPASMDLRWWQYMLLDVAFAYSLLAWLLWRIGCKFAGGLIRRRPHNQHMKAE